MSLALLLPSSTILCCSDESITTRSTSGETTVQFLQRIGPGILFDRGKF